MIYDVAIIGAGPAGSSAAYELAKNGLKVIILDKEKFPRFKACGGGLSLKAYALFDFNVDHLLERKIKSAKIFYKTTEFIELGSNDHLGYIVNREIFDHFLVQKAIEKGAEFRDESEVLSLEIREEKISVILKKDKITSRFVIGADGALSFTAGHLGIKYPDRIVSVATEIEMNEMDKEQYKESLGFDFGFVPGGYAWIFPGKDRFSVGIYSLKKINIVDTLKRFIKKQGLSDRKRFFMHKGGVIPLGGIKQNNVQGNILLAGDAAGLVDPFLGEGIYYAVKSGQLAAKSILDFLEDNISLNIYNEKVYNQIVLPFKYAKIISFFIFRFSRIGFFLLKKSRYFQNFIINIITGQKIY